MGRRWLLTLLTVSIGAACSSGNDLPSEAPLRPVSDDDVVYIEELVRDGRAAAFFDLETADVPQASHPVDWGLPESVRVFHRAGQHVVVAEASAPPGASEAFPFEAELSVNGHTAAWASAWPWTGEGCRRQLMVDLGKGRLAAVWGTVGDDALRRLAATLLGEGSVADSLPGWRPAGELPAGWQIDPRGVRIQTRGTNISWAVVLPVDGMKAPAFDALLCEESTPLRTGISGRDRLDLSPWERHERSVDGSRVVVGIPNKQMMAARSDEHGVALIATIGLDGPSRSPHELAELVTSAERVARSEFMSLRRTIVDGRLDQAEDTWRRFLGQHRIAVFASGRHDDVLWLATDRPPPPQPDRPHPYVCMQTVQELVPVGDLSLVQAGAECFSAGRASGVLVPGVHVRTWALDHLWGISTAAVAEVAVTLHDGVELRGRPTPTGIPSLPNVFFVQLPPLEVTGDSEHRGFAKLILADKPLAIRAHDDQGRLVAELAWGGPTCPIDLPEACEQLT